MASVKPCPDWALEELKKRHKRNPDTSHYVLWDTTYYLNEDGSCRVVSRHEYLTLEKCDGYDPTRYELLAAIDAEKG